MQSQPQTNSIFLLVACCSRRLPVTNQAGDACAASTTKNSPWINQHSSTTDGPPLPGSPVEPQQVKPNTQPRLAVEQAAISKRSYQKGIGAGHAQGKGLPMEKFEGLGGHSRCGSMVCLYGRVRRNGAQMCLAPLGFQNRPIFVTA